MPVLKFEQHVKASPTNVWKVISDVSGFAEVAPYLAKVEILSGERDTLRRRVVTPGGNAWEEYCTEWLEGRRYTMEVDTRDVVYPFKQMTCTYALEPADDGTLIKTRYEYRPKLGLLGVIGDLIYGRKKLEANSREVLANWVHKIHDAEWKHTVTVQTVLNHKGGDIVSARPTALVGEVATQMRKHAIGTVLIIDANDNLVGIVSERDIVYTLADKGSTAIEERVETIMSVNLVVCAPDSDMEFVMVCMTDKRVRHLPVLDGERLVGIISIGDVVRQRISSLEAESRTMREYIEAREWRYHQHVAPAEHDLSPQGQAN